MGLPGVKVGPLDPDATAEFGQVSQQHNARTLIRLHSQMNPPQLTRALALKRDDERTKALDRAEVADYLRGLRRENGDPALPDGSELAGAAVRGERDRPQVLTYEYVVESGRTRKWFAPYDRDRLPNSAEAGDELVKVKEMRDRGIVAFDEHAAGDYFAQRELARLRRENRSLRDVAEARSDLQDLDLPEHTDDRPDVAIVEELEQLRREKQDLVARVAQLEVVAERAGHASIAPEGRTEAAAEDPPVEGYDDLNAGDVVKLLRADETSPEQRQALLDYERRHANRRTVVSAAEQALGRTG